MGLENEWVFPRYIHWVSKPFGRSFHVNEVGKVGFGENQELSAQVDIQAGRLEAERTEGAL